MALHSVLQLLGQFLLCSSSCLAFAIAILSAASCAKRSLSRSFNSFILFKTNSLCRCSSLSSISSSSKSSSSTIIASASFSELLPFPFFSVFSCDVSAGQQYFGHSLAQTIRQTDGQPLKVRLRGVIARVDGFSSGEQHCGGHSVVHDLLQVRSHVSEEW